MDYGSQREWTENERNTSEMRGDTTVLIGRYASVFCIVAENSIGLATLSECLVCTSWCAVTQYPVSFLQDFDLFLDESLDLHVLTVCRASRGGKHTRAYRI